jgi:hypothetical protein
MPTNKKLRPYRLIITLDDGSPTACVRHFEVRATCEHEARRKAWKHYRGRGYWVRGMRVGEDE